MKVPLPVGQLVTVIEPSLTYPGWSEMAEEMRLPQWLPERQPHFGVVGVITAVSIHPGFSEDELKLIIEAGYTDRKGEIIYGVEFAGHQVVMGCGGVEAVPDGNPEIALAVAEASKAVKH